MKSLHAIAVSFVLIFLLSGCSVKEVPVVDPKVIDVPDGSDTKPLSLGKIIFQIPAGKPIIRVNGGLACVQAEKDMSMPTGSKGAKLQDQANIVFYDELKKARYHVIGDPSALFEDDSSGMAEIAISGAIKDMWLETCYPFMRWGNLSEGSSSARISVE